MLFYTLPYLIIFLPVSILLFFSVKFLKIDNKIILIFLSLFFYSWWNIFYLPVILLSIAVNYYFTKKILGNFAKSKIYLFFGIFINILILATFKYADFFILNINAVFSSEIKFLNIPFPLAISFFTFQSIAFLINAYDGEILNFKAKDFCLFIVFFPQLIAGPIVRYNHMMPQFNENNNRVFNKKNFTIGLIILTIGFIKKVYFANSLATYVDTSYQNIETLEFFSSWISSLCFTFQIYFDFTGYVDMATGSALMINISLPRNFNSPLKSTSIIDYWQRWHITLSNFLTNYVYNPWLRSLKKINFFNSMSLIFYVFLIAGIWHGPSWNFVLYGALQGFGVIVNHSFKNYINIKIPKILAWFITFNFVNISFIFFRISDISDSITILKKMYNFKALIKNNFDYLKDDYLLMFISDLNLIACFFLSIVICFFSKNSYDLIKELKE